MPTYDYTGDGDGSIQSEFFRKSVLMKRAMKTVDIVASDTTLTTNGVIAAADVIQCIDIPAGFVFTNGYIKSVEVEVGAHTVDVGVAGSNEVFTNYDMTTAVGTITLMNSGWLKTTLSGYCFSAADTIDATYDHETDGGEWYLYIGGYFLD